jgi:hypothetical protein
LYYLSTALLWNLKVVYVDLDRDFIDLGVDETTGELRQPHHGARAAAAAGAGSGTLSSTHLRGTLAGRGGGWADGCDPWIYFSLT